MWSKNAFTLGTLLLCAWGDVSLSRCCAGYYHQHASTLATITSKKKCLCSQSLLFFQRRACGIFSSLQWASSVALLIFLFLFFVVFTFAYCFLLWSEALDVSLKSAVVKGAGRKSLFLVFMADSWGSERSPFSLSYSSPARVKVATFKWFTACSLHALAIRYSWCSNDCVH